MCHKYFKKTSQIFFSTCSENLLNKIWYIFKTNIYEYPTDKSFNATHTAAL